MNDDLYGQHPYGAFPNGPAAQGGDGHGYGFGYAPHNPPPPPVPPVVHARRWQPWHIAVAAALAAVLTACLCCGTLTLSNVVASTSGPDGYLGTGPDKVVYLQFHEHNGGLAGTFYVDVKDSTTGQIDTENFDLTGTHDGIHYTFTVHGWLGINQTVQGEVSGRVLTITYEYDGVLNQTQLGAASDKDFNDAVAQLGG